MQNPLFPVDPNDPAQLAGQAGQVGPSNPPNFARPAAPVSPAGSISPAWPAGPAATPNLPDYLQSGTQAAAPGQQATPQFATQSPQPGGYYAPSQLTPLTQPTAAPAQANSAIDTPYIAPEASRDSSQAVQPVTPEDAAAQAIDANEALNSIRQKLATLYAAEPAAEQEIAEVQAARAPLSRHQQYMQDLNNSGRSLAEVQAAWHEYYTNLPDDQKHQVWHEFYSASQTAAPRKIHGQPVQAAQPVQPYIHSMQQVQQAQPAAASQPIQQPRQFQTQTAARPEVPAQGYEPRKYQPVQPVQPIQPTQHLQQPLPSSPYNLAPAASALNVESIRQKTNEFKDTAKQVLANHKGKAPTIKDLKQKVRDTVSAQGKLQKKHHLQSLFFGLATGTVVVFIFLFSFFNEVLLSPFIQPSRTATETPIIVDPASAVVGNTPKVVIPKINVEIPVDYSVTSANNQAVEAALDNGIVHYPTSVKPGQAGNAAFFGHSSNNIFNPGKYKFAFVLLHKMVEGDTFYLTYEGKTYAYQVITKRVVDPTEVGVLGTVPDQAATATLITCDPPGTSLKRLVVVGKQISPDPAGNIPPGTPTPQVAAAEPATQLAGNGPTLWGRIWGSIF